MRMIIITVILNQISDIVKYFFTFTENNSDQPCMTSYPVVYMVVLYKLRIAISRKVGANIFSWAARQSEIQYSS